MARTGKERPLYMISVAADLAGVHPQTLRIYERKQLINPQRSGGNTRLYSEADIERLRLIQSLTQDEGVNLAGVIRIMEMQCEMEALLAEVEAAHAHIRRLERERVQAERARQVRTALARVHFGPVARREADQRG
jgi:MerR family transcriptional regulator/heat shock protein HspR